jgi:predicted nuclease of predicted toxin-antitoxin system
MKFLVDNQLPLQLAAFLRTRGHESTHVLENGMDEATDLELWDHAIAERMIVVSKDEDFVIIASRVSDTGRLVWVRLGNCRNPVLIAAFDTILDQLQTAFDSGQRIVEVR